jgi:hypothetical protein
MYVDTLPVTPTVSGSGSEVTITYVPESPLMDWEQNSNHPVDVRVQDVNGTQGEKYWSFFVPS